MQQATRAGTPDKVRGQRPFFFLTILRQAAYPRRFTQSSNNQPRKYI
jgi:hypothetical protein